MRRPVRISSFSLQTLLGITTAASLLLFAYVRWWPATELCPQPIPILGPLTSGQPVPLDPPSDDEVLAALQTALPPGKATPSNNVRIVREKTADYVDAPRTYPLVGPAQAHHAHYRCTVYFDGKFFPGGRYMLTVDHNHLQLLDNAPQQASVNRDGL